MSELFIFAGQSEMVGYGNTAADLPTHLQDPIVGAMIWNAGAWQVLEPGVNTGTPANPEAWGPIAEFAYRWVQDHPGEKAYFIPSAKGSTDVAQDAGALDWSPQSTGELYDTTTTLVADAKAALAAMGVSTHVSGIVWDLGQTAASVAAKANAYEANQTDFFEHARDDWADPTTPIFFGRVDSASGLTYASTVQAAQDHIAATDGNAALFNTDALGLQADMLHYNAAGQVDFGAGLYDLWVNAPRTATGTTGADTMIGGSGDDSFAGGSGSDYLFGSAGDDWLQGNADADTVYGGQGADTVIGGAGNDIVRGGQGDDVLEGANGDDWLSGDLGSDTITGGAGADIFHASPGAGVDRITDFNISEGDRVLLDAGDSYSLSYSGADTIINHGSGDAIVLVGVHLGAGDPIFVGM